MKYHVLAFIGSVGHNDKTYLLIPILPEAQYELVQASLETAELQVEDLKIQLDDALGAEEMLELLTEKNLTMSEVGVYSRYLST